MADKRVRGSSGLGGLPATLVCRSLRPGWIELKAWKWVLRSFKVEFSL
jgi:hypothetical protein